MIAEIDRGDGGCGVVTGDRDGWMGATQFGPGILVRPGPQTPCRDQIHSSSRLATGRNLNTTTTAIRLVNGNIEALQNIL